MSLNIIGLPALRHFSKFILAHWFYITLILVYFFVINGLRVEESRKLSIIKESYSLISTKTDKRKGNIFFSTPDYFLKMSELVPEVDTYLDADFINISFSYPVQGKMHTVTRELPLYLIGSGFFDAFDGRFIQGRGFTRNEVFSGKPVVVLSEGALIKIFGDYDRAPSTVWINGVEYQVVGTWSFGISNIVENEAVFLPLGLTQMYSDFASTYVNNFILKGKDSRTLVRLKKAIDKIQMDAGYSPIRPEFVLNTPFISKRTEFILAHNKVYIDLLIWIVFIGCLFYSVRQSKQWMSYSQSWAVWLFMLKGNSETHPREASNAYFGVATVSLIGAVLTAFLCLAFLQYFMKYSLHPGTDIHPSFWIYLLVFPIQVWLFSYWKQKMVFEF